MRCSGTTVLPLTNKAFNYSGNGRIQIVEVTDKGRIVVDTTSPYTGTLLLREGPLLILIGTDGGPWTIS